MKKKIISLCLFALIIILSYSFKETFFQWMKEGGILSVTVSILFVAVEVFFPVVPFAILSGLIGALFGVWEGTIVTLSGAMLGTMILFFLSRYGFREWAQTQIRKYPKIKQYESQFEKNSFIVILLSRLVPVIPAPVVNIACGLSKVNWIIFFGASFLGKIPNDFIFNWAGATFEKNKLLSFLVYGVYTLVIVLISAFYFYKKGGKEELVKQEE